MFFSAPSFVVAQALTRIAGRNADALAPAANTASRTGTLTLRGVEGVAYLTETLQRRCFPELWSLRTKL